MNVDRILAAMNGRGVEYILIGRMNFALRRRKDRVEFLKGKAGA